MRRQKPGKPRQALPPYRQYLAAAGTVPGDGAGAVEPPPKQMELPSHESAPIIGSVRVYNECYSNSKCCCLGYLAIFAFVIAGYFILWFFSLEGVFWRNVG